MTSKESSVELVEILVEAPPEVIESRFRVTEPKLNDGQRMVNEVFIDIVNEETATEEACFTSTDGNAYCQHRGKKVSSARDQCLLILSRRTLYSFHSKVHYSYVFTAEHLLEPR